MTTTHGLSKTKEYVAWTKMKDRCLNPRAKDYPRYGGRGICISDRWLTFAGFLADMGRRPSDMHSVERVDNDGNYEPSNCRWATRIEQHNNTRRTHFVNYRGRKMSVANAVRAAGSVVSGYRAYQRLKAGWSLDTAVELPPQDRPR